MNRSGWRPRCLDATQIHTHLCYSEFGEVIGAIADLDADVTSIEAARSHMEVLDDLNAARLLQQRRAGCLRYPLAAGADKDEIVRVA